MNGKTDGSRGPRRAATLAVVAAVAVLTAACGVVHVHIGSSGDPGSASVSAPNYVQVLALAQCMRSHGEPNFPDPNASGGYTLTTSGSIEGAGNSSIDIDSSQAQAAYGDCRHLLPGAPSISRLEQLEQQGQQREEQDLPQLLKYSQCMRSNGVPNFPDFGSSDQSPPPGNGAAINPNSQQFRAAATACQRLLPAGAHVSIHTNASA
jgi:hypothetical protein